MSNLTKLEFVALDISGNNYYPGFWMLNYTLMLRTWEKISKQIIVHPCRIALSASLQDRAEALIFLRHHLDESLKNEYLIIKDPLVLWQSLQDRYDHHKISLMRICSKKTFTIFHASNVLLQQQYRERRFTKYSELIACLLVAEKNNELFINLVLWGFKHFLKQMLLLPHPIAIDKGTKMGRLGGKDEDVVVVEGVAVVIILEIVTMVPSKIRKAIPIKGSYQIHRQPLARVSLNAN